MKNKKPLYAIALVAVIVSAFAFVLVNGNDASPTVTENSSAPVAPSTAAPAAVSSELKSTSGYLPYSEAQLASATGQRVLFFHAPWCYQCQELDKDLQSEGAPAGYTIFKVDYDSNEALRQKYGITFRTAFLKVDATGNAIGKEYIAYDEPTIAAVKRDFLTQ